MEDTAPEGEETVVVTLNADAAYQVGSPNIATVTIQDNDGTQEPRPTVTVVTTISVTAALVLPAGEFRITRTGSLADSLTVRYDLSGSAVDGADYTALSGVVTIPAGASSAVVRVVSLSGGLLGFPKTVVLSLRADAAYCVGQSSTAIVSIVSSLNVP